LRFSMFECHEQFPIFESSLSHLHDLKVAVSFVVLFVVGKFGFVHKRSLILCLSFTTKPSPPFVP
jgi:hypothetical protein